MSEYPPRPTGRHPRPGEERLKSEGERRIARALTDYGLPYIYERRIPVPGQGGRRYLLPDFYLPTIDTCIEFYGRAGNVGYDERTTAKQRVYEQERLRVIALYPWDLCHRRWPQNLMDMLNAPGPSYEKPASQSQGYRPKRVYRRG